MVVCQDVTTRIVERTEEALVFSFLTIAARMDESSDPIQLALGDSDLKRYWIGWGREGDIGVVAESVEAGYPLGCAWVRLFSDAQPGYGFVAGDIPELAIGVVAGARARGIGSRALERLLELCYGRFPGISLSVRRDNPAIRLYERFGFQTAPGSEARNRVGSQSITMLLRF